MFSTEQFPNPLDYVIEINLVFLKAEHFQLWCSVNRQFEIGKSQRTQRPQGTIVDESFQWILFLSSSKGRFHSFLP